MWAAQVHLGGTRLSVTLALKMKTANGKCEPLIVQMFLFAAKTNILWPYLSWFFLSDTDQTQESDMLYVGIEPTDIHARTHTHMVERAHACTHYSMHNKHTIFRSPHLCRVMSLISFMSFGMFAMTSLISLQLEIISPGLFAEHLTWSQPTRLFNEMT